MPVCGPEARAPFREKLFSVFLDLDQGLPASSSPLLGM
jgi:hypothetical protein